MKNKQPVGTFTLLIAAQQANPSPPVGPACGQRGLNIMEVCKRINDECKKIKDLAPGDIVPAVITFFADKSFNIIIKKPPVSNLVKKYLKLAKGSKTPGLSVAGTISPKHVEEIAKIKMEEMGVLTLTAAISQVEGTCRSMGIKVEGK